MSNRTVEVRAARYDEVFQIRDTIEQARVLAEMPLPEVEEPWAIQYTLDLIRDGLVFVAVVDRAGTPQVMLRDRFAGAHTPDTAIRKAWTAVSFRTSTTDLANETQAGKLQSGIRQMARVAAIGGGWMIEAAGSILGGIGVSGAPGAAADDDCAKAGIAAIRDALDF